MSMRSLDSDRIDFLAGDRTLLGLELEFWLTGYWNKISMIIQRIVDGTNPMSFPPLPGLLAFYLLTLKSRIR